MRQSEREDTSEELRVPILRAAAACFRESGYAATSIDDVARRLGATKGRIYHHYPSKADLFFDVYRMGMDINFEAIRPIHASNARAVDRLKDMCRTHVLVMIERQDFQRVVWQGVELHVNGPTTPAQRIELERLIRMRAQYDQLFREVMEEAKADGDIDYRLHSIAVSTLFAAMNGPVFWYKPRADETRAGREEIADEIVRFCLRGLGWNERKDT